MDSNTGVIVGLVIGGVVLLVGAVVIMKRGKRPPGPMPVGMHPGMSPAHGFPPPPQHHGFAPPQQQNFPPPQQQAQMYGRAQSGGSGGGRPGAGAGAGGGPPRGPAGGGAPTAGG